jgi:hypothetical protein
VHPGDQLASEDEDQKAFWRRDETAAEFAESRRMGYRYLDELFESSRRCRLCQLIADAAGGQNISLPAGFGPVKCMVSWGTDGYTIDGPQTRSLEVNLSPSPPGAHVTARIVLHADDAPPEESKLFCARTFDAGQIDFEMLRQWTRQCQSWHGDSCEASIIPYEGHPSDYPSFRLVDIHNQCVTRQSANHCKYAALSYVWGRVGSLCSTKSNISELEQPGALAKEPHRERLPETIKDAMIVLKELGLRYLWVDMLCIVQDDDESKAEAIGSMDLVYGEAFLTVIAATGQDANAGLPGVRPNSRGEAQRIVEVMPGLRLVAPRHWDDGLSNSVYDSRAWT